jgi:hypothetical protein
MQAQTPVLHAGRMVRLAAAACGAAAVAVVIAFVVIGQPLAGGALAAGLLLGTLNGVAAARLISFPIPFFASSLLRIVTLSMLGILIGLAFGISRIWLVILGLGFAQLALAGAAIREAVRR